MSDKTLQEIDLDDVVRKPLRVHLNGEYIIINLPTFEQIIHLIRISASLAKLKDMPVEEHQEFVDEVVGYIYALFPQLEGKNLTLEQLGKLMTGIYQASLPASEQALAHSGLSRDIDGQKKTDSDLLE